ncbi:MAG: zinc ABC transporter substrate-binding protein [Clostridia bacterium]|nr:zinc ABC transporter substrate-binding protein [Clostridia bacterium]
MKRLLALLMCVLLLCGCTQKEEGERLTVVATLFPQYDFCREIIGDKGTVTLILPAGMESHNFEPGVEDIAAISKSDLFLYTGDAMEPWAATVIKGVDAEVVDVSEGVNICTDVHTGEERHGHDHSGGDPHIWTSIKNAKIMVDNILKALIRIDEKNSEYYIKNAQEYLKKLDALDEKFTLLGRSTQGITLCHGGKLSSTYLERDYGIKIIAAYDSCSEWAEPSVLRVKEIIEAIRSQGLKAVLYEELSQGRIADTIKNEAGVEKLLLHTCHNLTKEEMNKGETYISLMEKNIYNLNRVIGKNA